VVQQGATLKVTGDAVNANANPLLTLTEPLTLTGDGAGNGALELLLVPAVEVNTAVNPNLPGNATINAAITVPVAATIGVDGGILTISGAIGGPGDLSKVGTGTLNLTGNNGFTGPFTIDAGNVTLGSATALGAITGGTAVADGASLVLNSATTYVGELLTLSGQGNGIIGPQNINVSGPNTARISPLPVNMVQDPGALLLQAATATWTGNILLNPDTLINSVNTPSAPPSTNFTISGVLADAPGVHGDLVKGGNGTLTLTNVESYTGATTIRFGQVTLSGGGALPSTTVISVGSGGPLSSSGTFLAGALTLDDSNVQNPRIGDATPIDLKGGSLNLLGSSNPGAVTEQQVGAIHLLAGSSTISDQNQGGGLTQLVAADLVRSPGATLGFFSDSVNDTTNDPDAPALGSPLAQVVITAFASGAPLVHGILPFATVATPGVVPLDWATYGTSGITAYASGLGTPAGQAYVTTLAAAGPGDNVRITASEALNANQTVNSLIVVGSSSGSTTVTEKGLALTIGSGAVMSSNIIGGGVTTTATLAGGSLDFGGTEGLLFAPAVQGNFTSDLVINSAITGSGGLTIAGNTLVTGNQPAVSAASGTVTLGADNTYTGTTALASGNLVLGTPSALGSSTLAVNFGAVQSAAALTVPNPIALNDGILDFIGSNPITFTGPVTLANPLTGTNYVQVYNTNAGGLTFAGVISGPGGLTLLGTNSNANSFLTITRANTFAGGVVFAGMDEGSIGNNPTLPVGTLNLTVGNDAALGTGPVLLNSGTLLSSTAVTLANPIVFDNNNLPTFDVNDNGGTSGNTAIQVYLLNNFLNFGNGAGTLPAGTPALTFKGPVSVAGSNLLYQNTVNATAFTGPITGDGGFVLTNAFNGGTSGPLILSGQNSFSGGITVFGGQTALNNSTGSVATLAFGPGSQTLMQNGTLISGPFGTGTVQFLNNPLNNSSSGPGTGSNTTMLLAPDDGNSYDLANNLVFGAFHPTSSTVDTTTINVGATNPGTTLRLTGDSGGYLGGSGNLMKAGAGTLDIATSYVGNLGNVLPAFKFSMANTQVPFPIGSIQVTGGTLTFSGAGNDLAQGITVNGGTTLTLDNTGVNDANRLSDGNADNPTLTFNGGTLNYLGAPGAASTETFGPIALDAGAATVQSTPGPGGGTVVLNSAGMARQTGGTVNFVGVGAPIAPVVPGTDPVNQFVFQTPPTATATNNPGTIGSIAVTGGGAGYTSAPAVVLTGGGGTYKTATATVANGVVTGVTITGATGYSSLPTVSIAPPAAPATATATIDASGVVTAINIADGGSGYTSVPTVTIAGDNATTQARAVAVLTNGVVTGITVTNPGAGYLTAPFVTISPPTAAATATAAIDANGLLSSITVTGGGAGYTSTPAVTLVGGGFTSPATATAVLTGGVVTAIHITGGGAGYTSAPLAVIAPPASTMATATAILANPDGFLPFATVTGTMPTAYDFATYYPGDNGSVGIGATLGYASNIAAVRAVKVAAATAVRTGDGISTINVTSLGAGYTFVPNVTLVGGGATRPATAVATVVGGAVIGITVVDAGSGYTSVPTVVIDAPLADVVKVTGNDSVAAAGATIAGLLLDAPSASTITLNGSLTLTGGAIAAATGSGTTGNRIAGSGSLIVPIASANIASGTLAEAYLLSNTNATSTLSRPYGPGSPASALTTAGGAAGPSTNPGTWILSTANTYTGITTVGSGILQLQNNTALGTTGRATIIGGGSLRLTGSSGLTVSRPLTLNGSGVAGTGALLDTATLSSTWSGAIALTSPSAIGSSSLTNPLTISGVIGGANGLSKVGDGGLTLRGANTYTGPTVIDAGTITTGSATAIPTASFLTVNPGATLAASTALTSVAGLFLNGGSTGTTVSGTITALGGNVATTGTNNLISAALTVAATRTITVLPAVPTGNELNISGAIAGAGGITKAGGGTLIYSGSGANRYTGTTTDVEGLIKLSRTAVSLAGPLVIGNYSQNDNIADVVTVTNSTNQFAPTVNVTINGSGQLDTTSAPATIGSLTLNGGTLAGSAGPNVLTLGGDVTATSASTPSGIQGASISGNLSLGSASRTFTVADAFNPAATATALAAFSNGSIAITVSDRGSGYSSIPAVTLTGGGFTTPATATAVVVNNRVVAVNVSGGTGYTSAPTVTIAPPPPLASLTATALASLAGASVGSITLLNGGGGYTAPPIVSLVGGGGIGAAARAILAGGVVTGIAVVSGGTGYTSAPSVVITPQLLTTATATASVAAGRITSVAVTGGGAGYTSAPKITLVGGGGTGAMATAVLTNGAVSSISVTPGSGYTAPPAVVIVPPTVAATAAATINAVSGTVTSIPITGGGLGYTFTPTVTLLGGGGTGATVTATLTGGVVTSITVTNPGSGYTSVPTVVITPPVSTPPVLSDATATATVNSVSGTVTSIPITGGGSGYTFTPAVMLLGGGGSGATATATLTGGAVTQLTVTNPGSGYTSAPTVVIAPPASTPLSLVVATAAATVSGGGLSGLQVLDGGSGYTAPPLVTITGGGGSGATAYATIQGGAVVALTIANPGTGYTSAPTTTIGPPIAPGTVHSSTQAQATGVIDQGTLDAILLTDVGSGYTYPPTVTIVGGRGRGATATATVTNGVVSALTITSPGSGYTSTPTITIDPPPSLLLSNVPGLTITATISGGGSAAGLSKTGTGTLNLNGSTSSTYTGITNVLEGTLLLNNVNGSQAIGASSALNISDLTGGPNADVVRLLGPNQMAPTTSVVLNDSGLLDLNGFVVAVGSLAFVGGNVSLGATGTGSLVLGADVVTHASPYASSITGDGTLDLGGVLRTFNVDLGTVANAPDLEIAVPIVNDGGAGLIKSGPGSLLLSGDSTFTGPTSIDAGTLLVDGSLPGTGVVTVDTGSVLGGNGTVGAVTVGQGGSVNPGDLPGFLPAPHDRGDGTLTAASASFSGGGTLVVQAQTGATPGATYDRLVVDRALTLGGTSHLTADLAGNIVGSVFPGVVTYGTLTGAQFATTNVANAPPGLAAVVDYTTTPGAIDLSTSLFAVAAVTLSPANPTTRQVLTASVPALPASPGGGAVTLTYVWKNGTTVVRTHTTTALTDTLDLSLSGNGSKGDVITVTVTPTDNTGDGTPVTASTTIADAPPVATVVLSPNRPTSTQMLVATATASDDDGDPVSLTFVWTQNGSVIRTVATAGRTDALNLDGIARIGDRIVVTVTPNDGERDGTAVKAATTVVNAAPVATVVLSPSSPLTDQVLTASATVTDPGGNPVTLTYVWAVNGSVVKTTSSTSSLTDTLDLGAAGNGDVGDVVAVTVTPSDPVATGSDVTATTTVADSAPTASVSLNPVNPTVGQVLTARVVAADADGDPVTLSYVWTVNGVVVRTTADSAGLSDTLDLSTLGSAVAGNLVAVTVTPSDGTLGGTPAETSTLIALSAPGATVHLAPGSPGTSDVLTATATTSDADHLPVTLTYLWSLNGTTIQTTSDTTALTDTLDLGLAGHGDKGDVITVTVTPVASGISGAVASSSVTIVNSPPTAAVVLTPANPTAVSTLTATVTAADDDHDPLSFSYVWKQNGTVVRSDSGTSSTTDTLDLSGLDGLKANDVITVEVVPSDGTASGVMATDHVVVGIVAPTATVRLAPANPTTNQVLTATATASDQSGHPVTLTYVWTVNGTVVQTTSNTAALTDAFDLSAAGHGDKGDVVAVTVTPNNGILDGAPADDSITVANSPPTAAVTLAPADPTVNQTLTATATDADADSGSNGDLVLLTYVWTVNGTTVQTTSNTTALTDTLDLAALAGIKVGDAIGVQVTPFDRTDHGTPAAASTVVVASVPVARDSAASLSHRSTTGVDITLAASDAEGSTLTFNLVDASGGGHHGTLTLDGNVAHYTPTSTFIGTDTFQFTASNGTQTSTPATVTIMLTNSVPAVIDSSSNVVQNNAVSVAAPGVLTGATDADGDPLSAKVVAGPSQGTLVLNPDGSFTYTPAAGFVGTDSFQFAASDGAADSNTGTVTLTVANIPPVANDDSYSVQQDTTLAVPAATGVLGNDTDSNKAPLTAVLPGGGGPAHGTLNLAADGSFVYTPEAGYTGPDSFTYRAFDGTALGNTATVTLTVTPFHRPPSAGADAYRVAKNGMLDVPAPGVLGNDSGSGTLSAVLPDGGGPAHGTLTLHGDGSFIYTPNPGFSGSDSFTYEANDGLAASDPATVTIEVVNAPPVAADDSYSVDRNGTLTVDAGHGVLANDADANGDPLTAQPGTIPTAHGSLTLQSDGSFTYAPAAGYAGPDGFTYKASDGTAASDEATVAIQVVNTAPVATGASFHVGRNGVLVISSPGLLADVTDANHDMVTIVRANDVGHGSLVLNADGTFTYTPTPGYAGPDGFTYHANDGLADSNDAAVSISVDNTAPAAAPQDLTVGENGVLAVTAADGLLKGATDVDNDSLTVGRISTFPLHGSLSAIDLGTGAFTYTPEPGYSGSDSFSFQVNDGLLDSPPATVSIAVTPIDVPVAADDAYTTPQGTVLNVPGPGVLNNDHDPGGARLAAVVRSQPVNGSLTLNDDGSFVYTPAAGFVGVDNFTYRAFNGSNSSDPVTVVLTVTPVQAPPAPPPPMLTPLAVSTVQGTPLVNAISASFTSPDAGRTASSFSATINWGDGSPSMPGTIASDATKFLVFGSHSYANSGSFTVLTTVTDPKSNSMLTVMSTATVTPAPAPPPPISVTGRLAPGAAAANVDGTPVVAGSTPSFTGTAPAGFMVTLMAQAEGATAPTQVGLTTAQADGTWTLASNPRSDGSYTYSVEVFDPSAPAATTASTPIGRVIIQSQGPRVGNITFDARHGLVTLTYRDNVGLSAADLANLAAYTLTEGSRVLHPTLARVITAAGGPGTQTIALTFDGGKKLKPGQNILAINSGLLRNLAGNPLDGEFKGSLPSGNGAPSGDFQASYIVKNNARRSARGPFPVLVSVAKVHPNRTQARAFAARHATGIHAAAHVRS
jgi:autotransporter-associated beta strand protein